VKHARRDYDRIQDPWLGQDERAIPKDEPVFLIRAQDRVGWIVVLVYAIMHYVSAQMSATSAFTEPRQTALICIWHAMRMLRWAKKKNADIPFEAREEALTEVDTAELAAQKREEGQQ
jgi:hypothetical protein